MIKAIVTYYNRKQGYGNFRHLGGDGEPIMTGRSEFFHVKRAVYPEARSGYVELGRQTERGAQRLRIPRVDDHIRVDGNAIPNDDGPDYVEIYWTYEELWQQEEAIVASNPLVIWRTVRIHAGNEEVLPGGGLTQLKTLQGDAKRITLNWLLDESDDERGRYRYRIDVAHPESGDWAELDAFQTGLPTP